MNASETLNNYEKIHSKPRKNSRKKFQSGGGNGARRNSFNFLTSKASPVLKDVWKYFHGVRNAKRGDIILKDTERFDEVMENWKLAHSKSNSFSSILEEISFAFEKPGTYSPTSLLRQRFGQHLPQLETHIQHHARSRNIRDLTSLFVSLKRMNIRPSDVTLNILEDQFVNQIESCNAPQISHILYSMAYLGHIPAPENLEIIMECAQDALNPKKNKNAKNAHLRFSLAALAIMNALANDSGKKRKDIIAASEMLLPFWESPKTPQGSQQTAQINIQFGLDKEYTIPNSGNTRSKDERRIATLFHDKASKISGVSTRHTPDRIIRRTNADVDIPLSSIHNGQEKPLLFESDGPDHFLYGLRKDGTFGEVSWNGSTILNSSNIMKRCPEAVLVRIPYFLSSKFQELGVEDIFVEYLIQQAIEMQSSQYGVRYNSKANKGKGSIELKSLSPDFQDQPTVEAA
jgi:hypothetical protein